MILSLSVKLAFAVLHKFDFKFKWGFSSNEIEFESYFLMTTIELTNIYSKIREHIPHGRLSFASEEVVYARWCLNKLKGIVPDNVTPALFTVFSLWFCRIFNMIYLSSGTLPNIWKTCFIKPIFKSGSRCDVKNYRGISFASTVIWVVCYHALTIHFASYISSNQEDLRHLICNLTRLTLISVKLSSELIT